MVFDGLHANLPHTSIITTESHENKLGRIKSERNTLYLWET